MFDDYTSALMSWNISKVLRGAYLSIVNICIHLINQTSDFYWIFSVKFKNVTLCKYDLILNWRGHFLGFKNLSTIVWDKPRIIKLKFFQSFMDATSTCCTNDAPLVADLLLCYERDCMMFLPGDKDVEIIEAFNSTPRYCTFIIPILTVWSVKYTNQNFS